MFDNFSSNVEQLEQKKQKIEEQKQMDQAIIESISTSREVDTPYQQMQLKIIHENYLDQQLVQI